SVYDPNANCISAAPSGWVTAPAKKGDQFTVWAPAAYAGRTADAANEIRSKKFFSYYESQLGISRLGYPGQTGLFDLFIDPQLAPADKKADGVNAPRCGDASTDAADVSATIAGAEVFHAAIAHELFHAAQAQLGGNFTNNWWYEATATWVETKFGYEK